MKYLKLYPFQNTSDPNDIQTNPYFSNAFLRGLLKEALLDGFELPSNIDSYAFNFHHPTYNNFSFNIDFTYVVRRHNLLVKETFSSTLFENQLLDFSDLNISENEIAFTDNSVCKITLNLTNNSDQIELLSFIPLYVFKKDAFFKSSTSYQDIPIFSSLYSEIPAYFDDYLILKNSSSTSLSSYFSPALTKEGSCKLLDINFGCLSNWSYNLNYSSSFNNYNSPFRPSRFLNTSLSLNALSKTNFSSTSSLFENFEDYFSTKKKVLKSNNITSASKQKDFSLTTVQPKSLLSSSGIIFPTLKNVFFVDSSNLLKPAYIFSFTTNYADKMSSNTASTHLTFSFLQKSINENILTFFDVDKYQEFLAKKLANCNISSLLLLSKIESAGFQESIPEIISLISSPNPIGKDVLSKINSKLDVDTSRYDRITSKIYTISNSLKNTYLQKSSFIRSYASETSEIFRNKRRIAQAKINYQNSSKDFVPTSVYVKIPKLLARQSQEKQLLDQNFSTALKNQKFTSDLFFSNYSLLEVISIKYFSDNTFYTFSQDSFNEDYIANFLAKNSTSPKIITELVVSTKEPTKIIVDANHNSSKSVVGGPYIFKCTQSPNASNLSANIKLANQNSFFGVMDSSSFKCHPHSSQVSFKNLYTSWSSCCLGEATPLISKSMKEGDLKTLILSINIWLSSANSSDYWGKSYKKFISYSDYEIESQLTSSLDQYTDKDVQDSLIQFEELSQEEPSIPSTPPEPPSQETLIAQILTEDFPLQEEFVQQNTYNRYTPTSH